MQGQCLLKKRQVRIPLEYVSIWLYINIGVNVHTPLQDPVVKQGEEHAAPKADASMFMYN